MWAAGGDGFHVLPCDDVSLLVEKWAFKWQFWVGQPDVLSVWALNPDTPRPWAHLSAGTFVLLCDSVNAEE